MASTVHVIKRYANRKLYDTSRSRYVTLDELADMIDGGEEFQIIDNQTKEDLTRVTMAQILVEREKRGKRAGPLPALRGLIRNKGEQISRRLSEPVVNLRTSVEESVTRLIRTSEERAAETRDQVQAWLDHNQALFEEMQNRVDERVKQIIGRLDLLGQLDALRKRVERLESMNAGGKVEPAEATTETQAETREKPVA
ncbi:MAG: transcriptional regulator [Myxococcales bacterium]|nr:transcriptional regulator [Myxococcales bacterium]